MAVKHNVKFSPEYFVTDDLKIECRPQLVSIIILDLRNKFYIPRYDQ
jgi:hypothetical protein